MEWELTMDPGAAYIVSKLEKAGFEAYVVGGCVRDAQMGLIPKDWDITTSAPSAADQSPVSQNL